VKVPASYEHQGSIPAILRELCHTAMLEGAAIIDLSQPGEPVTFSAGVAGIGTLETGRSLLAANPQAVSHAIGTDHRSVMACPWTIPPARMGGLLLWRGQDTRPWSVADHPLATSVAMLLRHNLTAGFGQVGIDALTGIPNRRWFIDEADRRIDRLDRDGQVGTLSVVDIDNIKRLQDQMGRPATDRLLVRLAAQLRSIVRPADLVARVGEVEFALWQDGMDHMTAAERAESLCSRPPFEGLTDGQPVSLSIGIASRAPTSGEDIRTLLRRAHMAAREVKSQGGGSWRVSHTQPARRHSGSPE
jgi:diguanylate cyclase (GGDEF)-like protein